MEETIEKSMAYTAAVIKRIDPEMPADLRRFEAGITKVVMRAKGSPLVKLAELFRCMDKFFDYCARYTPCKKGCGHCCFYKVDVSELEVAYIEKYAGVRRELRDIRIFGTHGMPCPFLRGAECSIYRFRPYACRKHVTVDATNYWCHPSRCTGAHLMLLHSSECKAAYEMLVDTKRLADIRNYFALGSAALVNSVH